MKYFIALAMIASMSLASAADDQPKHIFGISSDGFGWSGMATMFEWDKDKSGIKDDEMTEGKLTLDYSYVFTNKIMLGLELRSETENREQKRENGTKIKSESSDVSVGIKVGYNFQDDLFNSWWVSGMIFGANSKSEVKDTADNSKTKFDGSGSGFTLAFGKRISLDSWGLKNISYNPTASLSSITFQDDAEDAGLEDGTSFRLDLIKIDILF